MSIATGIALLLTNGIPVYGMPKAYVDDFGRGLWLELPTAVYLAAAVVALMWVMQNFTRMGRYIYAIGGNLQAAVVSGVRSQDLSRPRVCRSVRWRPRCPASHSPRRSDRARR